MLESYCFSIVPVEIGRKSARTENPRQIIFGKSLFINTFHLISPTFLPE